MDMTRIHQIEKEIEGYKDTIAITQSAIEDAEMEINDVLSTSPEFSSEEAYREYAKN